MFFLLPLLLRGLTLSLGVTNSVLALLLVIFFVRKGHIGVSLIQLELIALFILSLSLTVLNRAGLKTLNIYLLFCVIASEAALALSFLVALRRQLSSTLEKFSL